MLHAWNCTKPATVLSQPKTFAVYCSISKESKYFPAILFFREDIFKEIDILCGLNHDNVVYLKEYFEEGNKVRQAARSGCF